jgi:hypothetical protein
VLRIIVGALLSVIGLALIQPWTALAQSTSEYDLKAAFLYNFSSFVEWPAEAFSENSEFVIGILGEDPFGAAIERTVKGKKIRGLPVTVKRFATIKDFSGANCLFISRSESGSIASIAAMVRSKPVLTVGDFPGFLSHGVVINFVVRNSKIHFEVNNETAKRANLLISSKLLNLAVNK